MGYRHAKPRTRPERAGKPWARREPRADATPVSVLLPMQRAVTGEEPRTGGDASLGTRPAHATPGGLERDVACREALGTLSAAQRAWRASAELYVRMDAGHP